MSGVYIDILIIGSGPAGTSTALHLVRADPAWAGRVVVVDKAVHPREKLCGGGITRFGADVLAGLGLSFEEVPHLPVREARLVYHDLAYAFHDEPVFRVVRRAEFDHWLVRQADQRGVMVRQGEAVRDISLQPDYVEVVTEQAIFRAKAVVAADGARSFVRQKLKWSPQAAAVSASPHLARLLEVLTPEPEQHPAFRAGLAVFDFSLMRDGLQGYYWDFPSRVEGRPVMNRGVFDSRVRPERPRAALKELLGAALGQRRRRLEDYPLKGHPIHWFNRRNCFARPRILLAGDAAGVDPLLGEGIPFALAYGQVAAAALIEAFARQDFSFADYRSRILAHPLLGQLVWRRRFAWIVYNFRRPWLLRLLWRSMPLIVRLLAWTNPYAVPLTRPGLSVAGDQ